MWLLLTTKQTRARTHTHTHTHTHTLSHHTGMQNAARARCTHTCIIHTPMSPPAPHTHTYTIQVRNHIYTQEHSLAINHIHTHTHTPAAHTSPLLVETQTPHANAPRCLSRRPQEEKKKQMGTSCLDESLWYTATVLQPTHTHTQARTRTHSSCLTESMPVLLLVLTHSI